MASYKRPAENYRIPCRGRSDQQWDNLFSDTKEEASIRKEEQTDRLNNDRSRQRDRSRSFDTRTCS